MARPSVAPALTASSCANPCRTEERPVADVEAIAKGMAAPATFQAVAAVVPDSRERPPFAFGVAASPPRPAPRSHTILRI